MKSYKFTVKGKVQGVYYRVNVQKNATASNFKGSVKNLSDGDVEAIITIDEKMNEKMNAQKSENQIETFKKILQKGSPKSDVTDIIYSETQLQNFQDFSIVY